MAQAYVRTAIPENGLRIKRGRRSEDGVYRLEVFEVTVTKVGEFTGEPFAGRRIYRTADGKVFSSAEEAAHHIRNQCDEL